MVQEISGRGVLEMMDCQKASRPVMRGMTPVAMLCSALATMRRLVSPSSMPHQ